MELGVNVPNFGPGTNPGRLRDWVGGARREFDALGADFERCGEQTDEVLSQLRRAWASDKDYGDVAGEGSLEQVLADLDVLRELGARSVVLDPFVGDPAETERPELAWQALATIAAHR